MVGVVRVGFRGGRCFHRHLKPKSKNSEPVKDPQSKLVGVVRGGFRGEIVVIDI